LRVHFESDCNGGVQLSYGFTVEMIRKPLLKITELSNKKGKKNRRPTLREIRELVEEYLTSEIYFDVSRITFVNGDYILAELEPEHLP